VEAGKCTSCHNPHQSALEPLLLAKSFDLCLSCHETLQERMAEERVHDPAEDDCLTCHDAHHSIQPSLLNAALHDLCGDCHDLNEDEDFQEAHLSIDAAVMNCVRCHAPHVSKDRRFFKPEMHSPFAKRDCTECHLGGEE